jgi:hypothetical protein
MKKASLIIATTIVLGFAQHSSADWGDRKDHQLDRKGDRINNQLDRKAFKAAANGNYKRAANLDRKGNRINNKLDRKGDKIERRFDNR